MALRPATSDLAVLEGSLLVRRATSPGPRQKVSSDPMPTQESHGGPTEELIQRLLAAAAGLGAANAPQIVAAARARPRPRSRN